MSIRTKYKKRSQKKSSKITGMKSEEVLSMAVEMINAVHPARTPKPLPPISLINRAISIIINAPKRAGNNLTKNSWYPNILFIINARKEIKGGVEANPQDK